MPGGASKPQLPSGTVTLLFTDIVGATELIAAHGDRVVEVLDEHHAILRKAVAGHAGVEVKTQGDGLVVGFAEPGRAVAACIEAQRALRSHPWPDGARVEVRMGLHTGPVHVIGHDYIGISMAVAARTAAAAHGTQILLTADVVDAIDGSMPQGAEVVDLGEHHLKGFREQHRLFEVRHPDLPSGFPPPRTLSATEHNLPAPPTAIVGRDADLEVVKDLLFGGARAVTLTGPGGIGKTRIALEAARAMLAYARGGVWLVDLAPVEHPDLLIGEVARTFGIVERPGISLLDALVARIGSEPTVLFLDNFEQVLDASGDVQDLVDAIPSLQVLVTSRVPLQIASEHLVVVEPLAIARTSDGPDAVLATPAGRLFAARARAADPTFELNGSTAGAVATICAHCHGIPLAIELAAARVREMEIGALAAGLGASIQLLSAGILDAPERHQAVGAAIAWSYDSLDAELQRAFGRLSVFAGGAPVEAAEAVAGAGPEHLRTLAQRSLIRLTDDRVTLLEPLRLFGLDRLAAAGGFADAAEAHAIWIRDVFRGFGLHEGAEREEEWFGWLDGELDNLRAALGRPSVPAEVRTTIAAATGAFWRTRGLLSEGRAWLEPLIGSGTLHEHVRVLTNLGEISLRLGDPATANGYAQEALRLTDGAEDRTVATALELVCLVGGAEQAREAAERVIEIGSRLDDPLMIASGRSKLSIGLLRAGHLTDAIDVLGEAIQGCRAISNARLLALCLNNLMTAYTHTGRTDLARAAAEEAIETLTRVDDRYLRPAVLGNLAVIRQNAGGFEEADRLLEECLQLCRETGDLNGQAMALVNLAASAGRRERHEEARARFLDALPLLRAAGNRVAECTVLTNLGLMLVQTGDAPAARPYVESALALARELGATHEISFALAVLAECHRDEGDMAGARALYSESFAEGMRGHRQQAVRSLEHLAEIDVADPSRVVAACEALGACDAEREAADLVRISIEIEIREGIERTGRRALGDEAFERALERGRGRSLEEAAGALGVS